MDVGRKGCASEICVFKVTPQLQGPALKSLVNLYSIADEHFEDQAIFLKRKFYAFKAKAAVIDANGMGIGLVDYLVKPQTDSDTGEYFPPFGVINDEEGFYKKYRTPDIEDNALYLIKANAPINTEAHSNVQAQMRAGKLKFLIDEKIARNKLLDTKRGQAMTPSERQNYLLPFTYTSILRDQMLNLKEEAQGVNIILKQSNRGIPKDKFSSFEYGLYYIKQEEDSKKKRKRDFSNYMFIT